MPATTHTRFVSTGGKLVAASRQAWLAGLGAAARTRELVQRDARPVLRTLVREGTAVEAQAMRAVESGVESSYALAHRTLREAQRKAESLIDSARTRIPAAFAAVARRAGTIGAAASGGDAAAQRAGKGSRTGTGGARAKAGARSATKHVAKRTAKRAAKPATQRAAKTRAKGTGPTARGGRKAVRTR